MQKCTNLVRFIAKYEEGSFIRLPFDISDGITRLDVCYSYSGGVIDIGVEDSSRIRGWSGGSKSSFYITRQHATPGYIAGSLSSGLWSVLLGAYKIPDEGCNVHVTVTIAENTPKWIKGDLHMHTVYSDGENTISSLVDLCRSLGLDYIAITDHNDFSHNDWLPFSCDMTIIPGMELTTYKGHANLLGVKQPIDSFKWSKSGNEVKNNLHLARQRGALVVINHPFDEDCGWHWHPEALYFADAVEVMNGPYRPGSNADAVSWYHQELCYGKKISICGGSDYHRISDLHSPGIPATWVYVRDNCQEDILEAVKRGNTYLTISPQSPVLEFPEHIPGDVIQTEIGERVKFSIIISEAYGATLRFFTSCGNIAEFPITKENQTVSVDIEVKGNDFIRAEIWSTVSQLKFPIIIAMTNAAYITVD